MPCLALWMAENWLAWLQMTLLLSLGVIILNEPNVTCSGGATTTLLLKQLPLCSYFVTNLYIWPLTFISMCVSTSSSPSYLNTRLRYKENSHYYSNCKYAWWYTRPCWKSSKMFSDACNLITKRAQYFLTAKREDPLVSGVDVKFAMIETIYTYYTYAYMAE